MRRRSQRPSRREPTSRGVRIALSSRVIEAAARRGRPISPRRPRQAVEINEASGTDGARVEGGGGGTRSGRCLQRHEDAEEPSTSERSSRSSGPVFAWNSPRPSPVRRMAEPGAPPTRRARAATHRPPSYFTEFGRKRSPSVPGRAEATREHARKRTVETREDLTPQRHRYRS